MSLSDLMSGAKLSAYAEVALVIFLVIFVAVVVYVFLGGRHGRWDHARNLPLDDDTPPKEREKNDER